MLYYLFQFCGESKEHEKKLFVTPKAKEIKLLLRDTKLLFNYPNGQKLSYATLYISWNIIDLQKTESNQIKKMKYGLICIAFIENM